MLKKEHIKKAIEAISARNAETGYSLDEMLSMGRIHPIHAGAGSSGGKDFQFMFDGQPVTVRRVIFFNQGTAPVQERLLLKYGEMLMLHKLSENTSGMSFHEAAAAVREAGLRYLVDYEVNLALDRVRQAADSSGAAPSEADALLSRLRAIKQAGSPLSHFLDAPADDCGCGIRYNATVAGGRPACFMPFPFCLEALIQAADVNLEFFNIRFLLTCLTRGLERNLFACVVNNRIEGIVYLTVRTEYLYRSLEIQYIATASGRPPTEAAPGRKELKGIGTVLTAGVWMLWKECLAEAKDLLLDSEIGARRFYRSVGFQPRGLSGFVMGTPRGRLVKSIVEMAGNCPELHAHTTAAIHRILDDQIRKLRKRPCFSKARLARQHALDAIQACLRAEFQPALREATLKALARYRQKIVEADALIQRTRKDATSS